MPNRNGTYKWIAGILAFCLIGFVTWWATQTWSRQEVTNQTNTQQGNSILTLQTSIIATDKAVMRIEKSLMKDRIHRRKQDSILIDMAIKVNIMFNGR